MRKSFNKERKGTKEWCRKKIFSYMIIYGEIDSNRKKRNQENEKLTESRIKRDRMRMKRKRFEKEDEDSKGKEEIMNSKMK